MLYYFFGFLLILLDFPITLGYGGTLNAIPDFLGYGLLLLATRRYGQENEHFRRLRLGAYITLPLSVAEFALDLSALVLPTVATLAIGVVMTVASLYITYEFSEGAKALERSLYKKFDADKISAAWIILCMASLLKYLAIYMPSVLLPCTLVHLLAIVWFESAVFHFERKRAKG